MFKSITVILKLKRLTDTMRVHPFWSYRNQSKNYIKHEIVSRIINVHIDNIIIKLQHRIIAQIHILTHRHTRKETLLDLFKITVVDPLWENLVLAFLLILFFTKILITWKTRQLNWNALFLIQKLTFTYKMLIECGI